MPDDEDEAILVQECGSDFELRVFFGQLGVRIAALNDRGMTSELPHLSSDQARELARRLLIAADEQDRF